MSRDLISINRYSIHSKFAPTFAYSNSLLHLSGGGLFSCEAKIILLPLLVFRKSRIRPYVMHRKLVIHLLVFRNLRIHDCVNDCDLVRFREDYVCPIFVMLKIIR